MKKAFMLVAAIALLAAPVFAEVEVAITGDATTSVGYNLDTEAFGMLSEVGSDITLTVGALDGESMGEGNWYGVIELTGANLAWNSGNDADEDYGYMRYEWNDDDEVWENPEMVFEQFKLTTPDVAAKITNGNVYVMLQSEADFDADYVDAIEENVQDDGALDFDDTDTEGSLTIGGTFAPVTLAVEFGTVGSYESGAQTDGVMLGANLGLDLAPIAVDVAFAGTFGIDDQEIGFAVQVVADVAPLMVTAAFDGVMNDEATTDFTYEAGLAVDVDLAPLTVGLGAYFKEDNLDAKLTVGFANDMITKADVFFGIYDLLADTDMIWETGIDLTIMITSGITANAGMSVDSDSVLAAYADVSFTELVDNVTFTLGWEDANDMLENDSDPEDMGQIYLSAGIEY